MRSFQKHLEKTLYDVPRVMLSQIVKEKLEEQGIFLKEPKINQISERILKGELENFNLLPWKFWDNRKITLSFTEVDTKRIEEESDKFLDKKLPELILSTSSDLAPKVLKDLKKKWPRARKGDGKDIHGFKKRLMQRWGKPIDSLKFFLMMSREFGEGIYQDLLENSHDKAPYLIDALTRLHARSCQVTYEVICLLENGLADGAMSRWRTLHEISVTALLISDYGEGMAERYIAFQHIESWKALQQYKEHHETLGQEPPTDEEVQELKNIYDGLISKFGKDFSNEYGWASFHLKNKSPRFSDLEKASRVDYFRPYYKLASYSTHASPKGIYFPMSNTTIAEGLILAGPSNAGLADPGHNTALSFMKVWIALSTIEPTFDTILFSKMMNHLASEIGDQFLEAHNELEADERAQYE